MTSHLGDTGVSVVRLAECVAKPWRNGGGITREIARHPSSGDFDWRLSIADVDRDGPFSEFPGIDRVLVLLRGPGMTLRFLDTGKTVSLGRPLDLLEFAGERPVDASLVGGPTVDLNLMWRRGHVTTSWSVLPCRDATAGLPEGSTVLTVVGSGSASLPDGSVLVVGDTVVTSGSRPPTLDGDALVVRFVVA